MKNHIIQDSLHHQLTVPVRMLSADMVEKAKSGHPGMPLGFADVVSVLYKYFLAFHPKDPIWPNRDRLIFSAGHGSALLYSLLYLTGYEKFTLDEIKNFRQLNSNTPGHPELNNAHGIETTTGPLGQGFANAVGMAISERKLNAKLGDGIINHKIYTIVGDGCLMEGISHEAASLAGHLKLKNLIVLFDDNGISIDGNTNITTSDHHLLRFSSYNWNTLSVDGHDPNAIYHALNAAQAAEKPTFIAFKTKIGFGSPTKEGTEKTHGSPLGMKEIESMKKNFNWSYLPFHIPNEILDHWRKFYLRNIKTYNSWQKNAKDTYQNFINDISDEKLLKELGILKQKHLNIIQNESTRKISGDVINLIASSTSNFIGGSCDLSGSNCTKSDTQEPIKPDFFSGNYIYYGVREQAMVSIMNGVTINSPFRVYGGTFLVFSDYARPSIRLTALMNLPIILIMTHDSIGVGEDGPTHQPVEHLSSLRCIPNLKVYRPCDSIETIECWELALKSKTTPSLLALTRQKTKQIRCTLLKDLNQNFSSKGAYVISEPEEDHIVTIFASGSEVAIAIEAKDILEKHNIGARIVSVPCIELFFEQSLEYQMSILCNNTLKVAIEAGIEQSWNKIIGPHGMFFGVESYGKSAPGEKVYEFFELTADLIAKKIFKTVNFT